VLSPAQAWMSARWWCEAGYLGLVRDFPTMVRALACPVDHKTLASDDSKRRNGGVGLQLGGAVGAWDECRAA
jgi:hypothetical protein